MSARRSLKPAEPPAGALPPPEVFELALALARVLAADHDRRSPPRPEKAMQS